MSYALTKYTGDGSTTTYTIGFNYRSTDDVVVTLDGVTKTITTDYTFPSSSQITFGTAPGSNVAIQITRSTSQSTRLVDYAAGSVFKESDLDTDSTQGFNMAQEAIDIANNAMQRTLTNVFDADNVKIVNVATPTAATDATNKSYVDTGANNAASSAAAALVSQNAAASSAAAALASQNAAASSQSSTAADVTATNADVVATNADVVSTNADAASTASDRTAAASSASSASTSAATATTKASDSSTSAAASLASQNAAATSAAAALASQNAAATSQTASATSESNASTSETNSATSATQSANSATASANSASAASTSESNAATSASTASTQATNSATSATNSANSATASANSATASANSASAASTSETNAASSATSASSAQTAAESARDATLAAYDNFDDRYLGAKSSAPTLDNDGNALVAGSLYFDTVAGAMFVYTGSSWVAAYVSGTGFLALTGGTMTGDLNFGDNDEAVFGAGTDLRIYHNSSNGNSHITESGSGSLVINGDNLYLQNTAGTENYIAAVSNDAVTLYHDNSAKIATTSSGVSVTGGLNTTGNVGIGTSAPTEDLHIKGQDGAHADVIIQAYTGYNSGLNFNDNAGMAGRVYYNHSSNFMAFDTNGSEAARIDSSGDVLIGKTSEAMATAGSQFRSSGQALDITRNGGSPFNVNRLSSDGELIGLFKDTSQAGTIGTFDNGANIYIGSGDTGVTFNPTVNGILPHNPSTNAQLDNAIDLGYPTYRFKDGYFGGTVNADALSIDSYSDPTNNYITLRPSFAPSASGGVGFAAKDHDGSNNDGLGIYGHDGISFTSGGSERARFNSSGNLLLGQSSTDTPGTGNTTTGTSLRGLGDGFFSRSNGEALYLNRNNDGGMISIRRSNSQVGVISVTTSGTTYNTTSDIRLKQDIEPLAATDKLMQMNPVSYSWKADPDGPRSMGFIAQQMQEVMPEAVSTGEDDDAMMSMDYGRITPILVAALQDAHRKIEQLEQRIADMEAK